MPKGAQDYGITHQRERRRWQLVVDAGRAVCWRCRRPIAPGAPWDLGHDDHAHGVYRGPEHRRCNRSAGARKAVERRRRRRSGATTLLW